MLGMLQHFCACVDSHAQADFIKTPCCSQLIALGSVCMWVCASVCLKGFFHLKTQNTTSSLLLLLQIHTQTHKCAAGASLITLIALYAHTCVKHTKIIFSNIPKGIWDLNVDKRMEHNCVYFVCGGGVMGLLFCNLLLDPRGSWIATPDYLGAGASTRKVIPWRQIESLSRLSLFSLNFFILSHSPFIFFLNLSLSDT